MGPPTVKAPISSVGTDRYLAPMRRARRRRPVRTPTLGRRVRVFLSLLIGASALAVPVVQASVAKANTLQMSADSSVTGWYPNEPKLSPANVTSGDFGEIFDTQLIGQIYAQPLVSQPTVLAVTENDYAYGLNSTTGAIEWQDSFGTPDDPLANIGCGDVGSDLGITGTPVIDSATDTAYFVVDNEEAGNTSEYFMEAVNVQTGAAAPGWPAGGVPIRGPRRRGRVRRLQCELRDPATGTCSRRWGHLRGVWLAVRRRQLERVAGRSLGVHPLDHHDVGQ